MKNIIIHTTIVASLLGFYVSLCFADFQDPSSYLLNEMNRVRRLPYKTAINLGYSPDYLKNKGISPETVWPDMKKASLLPDYLRAESLHSVKRTAMISFFNYMSLERACRIFINHMIRKDLESPHKKTLLFPTNCHADVFVSYGVAEDGKNAWFFSFKVSDSVALKEVQLLNLINQLRAQTKIAFSFTGNDLPPSIENSYPPLFIDFELYELFAKNHKIDMLQDNIPELELFKYGYDKYLYDITTQTIDLKASVSEIFSDMIEKELLSSEPCLLFSNRFGSLFLKMGWPFENNVKGTLLAARNRENTGTLNLSNLYVLAFSDFDGNSLYNPGEEYSGLSLKVYDLYNNLIESAETDRAGHIDLRLPSLCTYIFRIQYTPNHIIERKVFVSQDQFVSFSLPIYRK